MFVDSIRVEHFVEGVDAVYDRYLVVDLAKAHVLIFVEWSQRVFVFIEMFVIDNHGLPMPYADSVTFRLRKYGDNPLVRVFLLEPHVCLQLGVNLILMPFGEAILGFDQYRKTFIRESQVKVLVFCSLSCFLIVLDVFPDCFQRFCVAELAIFYVAHMVFRTDGGDDVETFHHSPPSLVVVMTVPVGVSRPLAPAPPRCKSA